MKETRSPEYTDWLKSVFFALTSRYFSVTATQRVILYRVNSNQLQVIAHHCASIRVQFLIQWDAMGDVNYVLLMLFDCIFFCKYCSTWIVTPWLTWLLYISQIMSEVMNMNQRNTKISPVHCIKISNNTKTHYDRLH